MYHIHIYNGNKIQSIHSGLSANAARDMFDNLTASGIRASIRCIQTPEDLAVESYTDEVLGGVGVISYN